MVNHSESISHTVSVPLQTTLGTLEEIACWAPYPSMPPRETETLHFNGSRTEGKEPVFLDMSSFGTDMQSKSQGASWGTQGPQKFLKNTICLFWTCEGKQKLVDVSGQSVVNMRQTQKHKHTRNCKMHMASTCSRIRSLSLYPATILKSTAKTL